jgi:Tfp pilus assembly protein PilF
MGATAKSALGKTTNAVAGVFSRNDDAEDGGASTDPLSLSNKPKSVGPEVFVANGQLWESTGDYGKAMESYTKALENEPNNAPALTSIARLHFRQGKHKQAVEFFQRAIAQNPEDAGLHNDLGLTLSKLGDHAAATKSLQKSLELAPGTSRYANNLASVSFEAGDSSSAYQVLAKNNKPAVAHFNMAYLHFKNGQMSEAKGHLGQALRYEPQASGDDAVERAVERSRDMLAQIDASMAPIAQAAPHASIAGSQFFGGAAQPPVVQQTSQSGSGQASVAPAAAPMGPATPAIMPSTVGTPAPTMSASSTPTVSMPTPIASQAPSQAKPAAAKPKPKRPMPVKPSESATDSSKPSIPFALPGGFSMPESK